VDQLTGAEFVCSRLAHAGRPCCLQFEHLEANRAYDILLLTAHSTSATATAGSAAGCGVNGGGIGVGSATAVGEADLSGGGTVLWGSFTTLRRGRRMLLGEVMSEAVDDARVVQGLRHATGGGVAGAAGFALGAVGGVGGGVGSVGGGGSAASLGGSVSQQGGGGVGGKGAGSQSLHGGSQHNHSGSGSGSGKGDSANNSVRILLVGADKPSWVGVLPPMSSLAPPSVPAPSANASTTGTKKKSKSAKNSAPSTPGGTNSASSGTGAVGAAPAAAAAAAVAARRIGPGVDRLHLTRGVELCNTIANCLSQAWSGVDLVLHCGYSVDWGGCVDQVLGLLAQAELLQGLHTGALAAHNYAVGTHRLPVQFAPSGHNSRPGAGVATGEPLTRVVNHGANHGSGGHVGGQGGSGGRFHHHGATADGLLLEAMELLRSAYLLHWGAAPHTRKLLAHGNHYFVSSPVFDLLTLFHATSLRDLRRDLSPFAVRHLMQFMAQLQLEYQQQVSAPMDSIYLHETAVAAAAGETNFTANIPYLKLFDGGSVALFELQPRFEYHEESLHRATDHLISEEQLDALYQLLYPPEGMNSPYGANMPAQNHPTGPARLSTLLLLSPIPLVLEDAAFGEYSSLSGQHRGIRYPLSEVLQLLDLLSAWLEGSPLEREVLVVTGGVAQSFITNIRSEDLQQVHAQQQHQHHRGGARGVGGTGQRSPMQELRILPATEAGYSDAVDGQHRHHGAASPGAVSSRGGGDGDVDEDDEGQRSLHSHAQSQGVGGGRHTQHQHHTQHHHRGQHHHGATSHRHVKLRQVCCGVLVGVHEDTLPKPEGTLFSAYRRFQFHHRTCAYGTGEEMAEPSARPSTSATYGTGVSNPLAVQGPMPGASEVRPQCGLIEIATAQRRAQLVQAYEHQQQQHQQQYQHQHQQSPGANNNNNVMGGSAGMPGQQHPLLSDGSSSDVMLSNLAFSAPSAQLKFLDKAALVSYFSRGWPAALPHSAAAGLHHVGSAVAGTGPVSGTAGGGGGAAAGRSVTAQGGAVRAGGGAAASVVGAGAGKVSGEPGTGTGTNTGAHLSSSFFASVLQAGSPSRLSDHPGLLHLAHDLSARLQAALDASLPGPPTAPTAAASAAAGASAGPGAAARAATAGTAGAPGKPPASAATGTGTGTAGNKAGTVPVAGGAAAGKAHVHPEDKFVSDIKRAFDVICRKERAAFEECHAIYLLHDVFALPISGGDHVERSIIAMTHWVRQKMQAGTRGVCKVPSSFVARMVWELFRARADQVMHPAGGVVAASFTGLKASDEDPEHAAHGLAAEFVGASLAGDVEYFICLLRLCLEGQVLAEYLAYSRGLLDGGSA
jgi:hypothetical protein